MSNKNDEEHQRELTALARHNLEIRRVMVQKLSQGTITFKEFCVLAQSTEYKTLRSMKIVAIMKKFPGWTEESVIHAFIAYGLPIGLTVKACIAYKNFFKTVSMLMNASATTWQKRLKAPKGFPWNGNIVKMLASLEGVKLPQEISEATRYYPQRHKSELYEDDIAPYAEQLATQEAKEHEGTFDDDNQVSIEDILGSEDDDEDDSLEDLLLSDDTDDIEDDDIDIDSDDGDDLLDFL